MPISPEPSPVHPFRDWVERCQIDAALDAADVPVAGSRLMMLAAGLPPSLTVAEQGVARRLLDQAWLRLLDRVAPSAAHRAPAGAALADSRAARALAEIDRRYADPRLRLRALARQLAVSDSRLTRILKETTGRTFGAHLHARRIADARALLLESSLSVKEIAGRVGYSTTTQLDRHFKSALKILPTELRATVLRSAAIAAVPRARHSADATQSPTQRQK